MSLVLPESLSCLLSACTILGMQPSLGEAPYSPGNHHQGNHAPNICTRIWRSRARIWLLLRNR